jgi:hypothetical protein
MGIGRDDLAELDLGLAQAIQAEQLHPGPVVRDRAIRLNPNRIRVAKQGEPIGSRWIRASND